MSLDTTNPPQVTGYLLLFRNTDWYSEGGYSDEEVRQAMSRVMTWFDGLYASGKVAGAQPLMNDTVIISGKGGRTVTDGPFAEAKEAIGGYVLLTVDSQEEAVAIARTNPMHDYGLTTEVRPVASTCPKMYELNQKLATAGVA
ncbi:MAG TPA: YciI family protein [Chthoniobacter sp.]|jgi:hypothetical protein